MCYDKAYLTKKKDFYANRIGNSTEEVNYLKEQLAKLNLQATYHVSGYEHKLVPMNTDP